MVSFVFVMLDRLECVCVCRVNLESIQSESNALMRRLKSSERKVSSSSEDVKEQYLSAVQVLRSRGVALHHHEETTFQQIGFSCPDFFCGVFSGQPAGMRAAAAAVVLGGEQEDGSVRLPL